MRKIPAALLSLALTASLTAPLVSAAGTGSTLPELDGHWSQSAFERWHAYGIVEGDSRGMRPDANMTVGEFAAILSRAMSYTETVENPYADLKGTEWYAPYILQLTAAGILQGDGTNCNAEEPMNRALCPGPGHPSHRPAGSERLCGRQGRRRLVGRVH